MDQQTFTLQKLKNKTIFSSSSVGDFSQELNLKGATNQISRKASVSNLPAKKEGSLLNYIQTKQCSQITKLQDNYKQAEDIINESGSSAFTIGNLLRQKSEQVRYLCSRLEQKESQYLELEKKMLELMKQNPQTGKFNYQYEIHDFPNIPKIPLFNVNSEFSTPVNNNTFANYETSSVNDNFDKYDQDYRSTSRLNKQRYLDFGMNYPTSRRNSIKLFQQSEEKISYIDIDYIPSVSKQNCLYEDIPEDDDQEFVNRHTFLTKSKNADQSIKTPSFRSPEKNLTHFSDLPLAYKQKPTQTRSLGFVSCLFNLRVQNFGVSCIEEKQQESEDFRKGFSIILSPKFSALNFKSLASSRKSLTFNSNIIDLKIHENSEIVLCKFKRMIKMQIEALNLVWKLEQKINRKRSNPQASQILKGLRNDLLSFVENFNKRHKLLKESGIGTGIFEDQTLDRLFQMLQLAKEFPVEEIQ